jgi:ankyrin repeat protein
MPSGGAKGIQTRSSERKLRSAAEKGDLEEVRKQLSEGADTNARNDDGWNALTLAVNNGHYSTVLLLLGRVNHSWQAPNIVTKDEALTIAVQKLDTRFVELLLKNGASVDAWNDRRVTVLMRAAYLGSPEIMKMLLDAGADLTVVDRDGYLVQDWAQMGKCMQCLELIEQKI